MAPQCLALGFLTGVMLQVSTPSDLSAATICREAGVATELGWTLDSRYVSHGPTDHEIWFSAPCFLLLAAATVASDTDICSGQTQTLHLI